MTIVVQKFGGTSVATLDRIAAVGERVRAEIEAGNRVIVVVSAMAGATNQLVAWVRDITPFYDPAEYDAIMASGEMVTSGLLALTLQSMGIPARSWHAWQLPIEAEGPYTKGHISSVHLEHLLPDVLSGRVAVVAGFQAISQDKRWMTLGRGGSDTSAVTLAAAIGASRCDIYTDMDGIYSADPRIVTQARKLPVVTFGEILELASLGAKILHVHSVVIACIHNIKLRVLTSFGNVPGTLVTSEEEVVPEGLVRGIALITDEERIHLSGDFSPIEVLAFLSKQAFGVDMITFTPLETSLGTSAGAGVTLSFLIPTLERERIQDALKTFMRDHGPFEVTTEASLAKISLVGTGLRSNLEALSTILNTVKTCGAELRGMVATELRVSVLVPRDYGEQVVRALHTQFCE